MNDEFGSWIWYCWKDKKPDDGEYIYVYWSDYPEYEVDIGKPEEFNVSLDENTYWCYVYIPDKPKISKIEITEEEREFLIRVCIRAEKFAKMDITTPFKEDLEKINKLKEKLRKKDER